MSQQKPKHWRVIYTKGRFEKSVKARISDQNIDVYLPLVKKLQQWSDRKKWVEIPLFPNYIFVRAEEPKFLEILRVPGVVRFIYNAGQPVVIRENQMADIMRLVEHAEMPDVEYDSMQVGSKVIIKSGPLKGMKGVLIQRRGKYKFSLEIDAIHANILVEIDLKLLTEHTK